MRSFGSGPPNGEYTARSTYKLQFYGSHPSFQVGNLWKARAEPKVKVLEWTTMHQRILTADNLASRGMQPNRYAFSVIRPGGREASPHKLSFYKGGPSAAMVLVSLAGIPLSLLDGSGPC
jgi:hypothetical protein